jgi:hypothetical protein
MIGPTKNNQDKSAQGRAIAPADAISESFHAPTAIASVAAVGAFFSAPDQSGIRP